MFDFFKLSGLQLLLYVTTGIAFFAICRTLAFAKLFGIRPPTNAELDAGTNFITGNINIPAVGAALIWFAGGCVVYLLLWTLVVVVVDGYNNLVISSSFVHPKSFQQSKFWLAIAGRGLIRFSAGVLTVILALIFARVLVPTWYSTIGGLGNSHTLAQQIYQPLVLLVIWIGLMHGFSMLLRLVFLRRNILG